MQPITTLHALVFHLAPTGRARVRATMGHQAHAAFLAAMHEADPDVARWLHDGTLPPTVGTAPPHNGNSYKPFTVSPLRGLEQGAHDGWVALSPERSYGLRLTLLVPELVQLLMERLIAAPLTLRLGSAEFTVRRLCATPEGDPEAGYTTLAQIWAQAEPTKAITLDFVTPTAFSRGGRRFAVLPTPADVFGSLLTRWRHLEPLPFDIGPLRALLDDPRGDLVIGALANLNTQMLAFERSPQVGFVGKVTYRYLGTDAAIARQLAALAALSFYTGVGSKTTQGMGQVRPQLAQGREGHHDHRP